MQHDHPAHLTDEQKKERQKWLDHFAMLAKVDRDYAIWAYKRLREIMPWLEL